MAQSPVQMQRLAQWIMAQMFSTVKNIYLQKSCDLAPGKKLTAMEQKHIEDAATDMTMDLLLPTVEHTATEEEVLKVMAMGKENTIYNKLLDQPLSIAKRNIIHGILVDEAGVKPGDELGLHYPVLSFPMFGNAREEISIMYAFFVACIHAPLDWVAAVIKLYPNYVTTDLTTGTLIRALNMCHVFAAHFIDDLSTQTAAGQRLVFFQLLLDYVLPCPMHCGRQILYGPEFYAMVQDDVRPNAACLLHGFATPFAPQVEFEKCSRHLRPRLVYAQHCIENGQFVTMATRHPFMDIPNETGVDPHPARVCPSYSVGKTGAADYKFTLFPNGKMDVGDNSKENEACTILFKKLMVNADTVEQNFTELSRVLRDMAQVYCNFPSKNSCANHFWPCTMPQLALKYFNNLSVLLGMEQDLETNPEALEAMRVVTQLLPSALASMAWPSWLLDLYLAITLLDNINTTTTVANPTPWFALRSKIFQACIAAFNPNGQCSVNPTDLYIKFSASLDGQIFC